MLSHVLPKRSEKTHNTDENVQRSLVTKIKALALGKAQVLGVV